MKFLKKHFIKFLMAFALVFTSLFVAFGCNTYAYTINNDGNLVGNNLFNFDDFKSKTSTIVRGDISYFNNGFTLTANENDCFTSSDNGSSSYYIDTNYNSSISLSCNTTNTYSYSIIIFEFDINWNRINIQSRYSSGSIVSTSFNLYNDTKYINIRFGVNVANTSVSFSNIMINLGGTPQEWEPYGVWYSQQNYDYQVDKYQTLLNSIYPFNKDLFSVNAVEYNGYDITDEYNDSFNYTIKFNGNSINFNTRDFDYLPNNKSSQGMNNFYMTIDYNQYVTANSLSFKIDLSHTNESYINIIFYDNNQIVTSTGDLDNENSSAFYTEYNTFSFNKIFITLVISASETQYNHYSSIVSGGTYAEGYSQASIYYNSQLSALSDMISIRDKKIISLNNSILELQSAYNTLNQSYENMLNGNNFANLFFTIAETPFASFKQIWNVDFLGVNLAGFVTGILFLGLVIWVIKKIF